VKIGLEVHLSKVFEKGIWQKFSRKKHNFPLDFAHQTKNI
jgi:hypothetical protein